MTDWRPVPGWESKYEVSDAGQVRSLGYWREYPTGSRVFRPGRVLRPRMIKKGHLRVALCDSPRRADVLVHRLVLLAFVGEPKPGQEALHWNDVPGDNRLANLRWGTRSENALDAIRNGLRPDLNKTHCKRGHLFDGANTYINRGKRHCRACRRLNERGEL